jgi:putative transposase
VGKIEGDWLEEEQKLAILVSIEQASTTGISQTRTCAMWMINRRRVVRWLRRWKQRKSLANGTPGPQAPGHRLLPQERTAVVSMATQPTYADLSHRILAVTASDLGLFFVSFSSVYRILCSEGLMGIRGHNRHHNGQSLPPLGYDWGTSIKL